MTHGDAQVPHEIGDFAILVQSGFTKKKVRDCSGRWMASDGQRR
jgi:hypothetical protein